MALIDHNTILSDKQLVDKTTLSERCFDFQSLGSYAEGTGNIYAKVTPMGAFTVNLRVQILGCNDEKFADAKVLGDSGLITKEKLSAGQEAFVRLNESADFYRYICLRYIASSTTDVSDTTIATGATSFKDNGNYAPLPKANEEVEDVKNGVKACLVDVATLGTATKYKVANANKMTA